MTRLFLFALFIGEAHQRLAHACVVGNRHQPGDIINLCVKAWRPEHNVHAREKLAPRENQYRGTTLGVMLLVVFSAFRRATY